MTREEAKLIYTTSGTDSYEQGANFRVSWVIDKIYDSFESRTCESCKDFINNCCEAYGIRGIPDDLGFKCDGWEKK